MKIFIDALTRYHSFDGDEFPTFLIFNGVAAKSEGPAHGRPLLRDVVPTPERRRRACDQNR
jgi:hypothetical protein